jgi:hypothetical protein
LLSSLWGTRAGGGEDARLAGAGKRPKNPRS